MALFRVSNDNGVSLAKYERYNCPENVAISRGMIFWDTGTNRYRLKQDKL